MNTVKDLTNPYTVQLDSCVGTYDTLNDLSNKVGVPNKTEHLILSVFSIMTGIKNSRT